MEIIVVDTNVLVSDPRLRQGAWDSLARNREEWNLKLVVPEIVQMETVNVVRRHWTEAQQKLSAVALRGLNVDDDRTRLLDAIDQQIHEYEQFLTDRLNEIGAEIAPVPPHEPLEMARRASEARAPYGRDKDGYRDTLIWLTVLDVANQHPDDVVWFVSDNHADFGSKDSSKAKGEAEQEFPPDFHDDLMADLMEHGLASTVYYVHSLRRLEQHIAAQFVGIDAAHLTELTSRLDLSALSAMLAGRANGTDINPSDAALPNTVTYAMLGPTQPDPHSWAFSEGARRGLLGWTARFSADADSRILTADKDVNLTHVSRRLRISGDITVSMADKVVDLWMTSVQALPGRSGFRDLSASADGSGSLDAAAIMEILQQSGLLDRPLVEFADQMRRYISDPAAVAFADLNPAILESLKQTPAFQRAVEEAARQAEKLTNTPAVQDAVRRARTGGQGV